MMVTKRRSLRLAVVGVLGATSLALAGTAMAATPAAHTVAPTGARTATAAKPAITATPSVSSVRAWTLFRVTGKTTGIKAGSKVTLQQKQHGTWVTLPASTPVDRSGSYALRVELGLKGKNDLRMVSGGTASPVFGVTVL
ncbi:hypothetical protein Shyhy01_56940 [Streptomyces hygroscopicus subsp. hygroscopicus]|uniref:hypothetical protein n=1 Tax=Streptomyces sp. KHY 26 TaxID=3097359 RepID=UPI0024A46981|nr:hypothetical protein [Streptomyces hygroscopicus]GLX52744.1 hypothetical protein Shyhy01_56940 [Streptomyces hygroscopicus subsp. hygroscopicus]